MPPTSSRRRFSTSSMLLPLGVGVLALVALAPPASANERAAQDASAHSVAAFLLAVALIVFCVGLGGALAARCGQPRVIGELLAGVALGPTLLGALASDLQQALISPDVLQALVTVSNLGLVLFMFLVGLELDLGQMTRNARRATAVSITSIALPMVLGVAAATTLHGRLAPDTPFVAFALFMGVAMSVTAFPVLARLLVERRMLEQPIGVLVLTCAAFDDVAAWCLLALATAVAASESGMQVLATVALAVAFCLVLALVVRPLLGWAAAQRERPSDLSLAAVLALVLLCAYTTEQIGIALIFGGFALGLAMPRGTTLSSNAARELRGCVRLLLLPLFFGTMGMRVDIGLLDSPGLWAITGALIAVAIAGKLGGAFVAARLSGFDWRASAMIGTLVNTRGLTELVVLNIGLEHGVISDELFAALVVMTLVTTGMAGPVLNLLDRAGRSSAPPARPGAPIPATAHIAQGGTR